MELPKGYDPDGAGCAKALMGLALAIFLAGIAVAFLFVIIWEALAGYY